MMQGIATALFVAGATIVADANGIRSPLNLAWMLGAPLAIAIGANMDAASRVLMGLILVAMALAATMTTGALVLRY